MRTLAATVVMALLAGCTSTVMAEPKILVSPYLAVYQLRGTVSMQSEPSPGQLQDNAAQTLRTFGQDHHREDLGIRADLGDGFGGVRIDYYRLDMGTADTGVLGADWGRLLAGDPVRMSADMDEFRIGYLEPLVHGKTTWREHPLDLQLAAGGIYAYRDLHLRARTDDGMRTQNAKIKGDVAYAAARFRAAYRDFAIDVDYAFSPDLVLGGDFHGFQQDFELRGSYTLAMRDVTLFAGYRFSEFPGKGRADGFAYDADLKLDGFQFGITVSF